MINIVQKTVGHIQELKTNKMEQAKYVTVLDFEDGNVFQYPIEIWDPYKQELQKKLKELGHNLKNCKWMVHSNKPIIH